MDIKLDMNEKELGRELLSDPEVRSMVLENARRDLSNFRCKEHGDAVSVSIGPETSKGFQLRFDACCDDAAEAAAWLVGN